MTIPLTFEVEVAGVGAAIEIDAPMVNMTSTEPTVVYGVTPGPRGPQGPPGSGPSEGTAWWYGEGPPMTLIGSKPGDYYIDTLTGTLYRLGD